MKDFDWFVRGADLQVGVFAALLDPEAGPVTDAATLSSYRD
jgi:hypothetical protein